MFMVDTVTIAQPGAMSQFQHAKSILEALRDVFVPRRYEIEGFRLFLPG